MVFTVFDRDALIDALKASKGTFQRIGEDLNMSSKYSVDEWDAQMKTLVNGSSSGNTNSNGGRTIDTAENVTRSVVGSQDNTNFYYADELPPFDGARYAA